MSIGRIMKQIFISLGSGLILLCLWAAIVVATSQDFVHEGPHGVWFSPIEAWGRFLYDIGWSRWLSSLNPVPAFLLGFTMLFGPFLLALSAVSYVALFSLRRMMTSPKLR